MLKTKLFAIVGMLISVVIRLIPTIQAQPIAFGVEASIGYSALPYENALDEWGVNGTASFNAMVFTILLTQNYLSIPVRARYSFISRSLFAFVGPEVGYILSAEISQEGGGIKQENSITNSIKQFNLVLTGGLLPDGRR